MIPDHDPDFLPIPDPGSRGQKGTGSQIPGPDPAHWKLHKTHFYTKKSSELVTITSSRILPGQGSSGSRGGNATPLPALATWVR